MNVISNTNFEINTQKIVANIVALNANQQKNSTIKKIQQFYIKFCWLIKKIKLCES